MNNVEELERRYLALIGTGEHQINKMAEADRIMHDMLAALKEALASVGFLDLLDMKPEELTGKNLDQLVASAMHWHNEATRLRAAIEEAPHHINCPCAAAYVKENCICWKRKALERVT